MSAPPEVICQRATEIGDEAVDHKKPDVMPGLFVFLTWVPQTDDEFDIGHGLILSGNT